MTPNLQMEQLSLAHVRAIAADAGYQVASPEPDTDSVYGILMARTGRRARIEFQAKATSQDVLSGDVIRFRLPVKNYNDLRIETWTPRILVVVLMPNETDHIQRLSQTQSELCLRYCGYWLCLTGEEERTNTSTVTVTIPTTQIFNKTQLNALMARVEAGDPIC